MENDTNFLNANAAIFRYFENDTLHWVLQNSQGQQYKIYCLDTLFANYGRMHPHVVMDTDDIMLLCTYCAGGYTQCSYSLISKSNGYQYFSFSNYLFSNEERGFFLYFSEDFSLILYDVNRMVYNKIQYPKDRIFNTCQGFLYNPKSIINECKIEEDILYIKYRFHETDKSEDWKNDTIIINLNNYHL